MGRSLSVAFWLVVFLAVTAYGCSSATNTSGDIPDIVVEFKDAYESGDLDRIRALYVEDGIWATTANVHELYHGGDHHSGTWGLDGAEFIRAARVHPGSEMEIIDAVQVGDRAVAFGWRWSDFASGTATLHLRNDRIAVAAVTVTEVEIPAP